MGGLPCTFILFVILSFAGFNSIQCQLDHRYEHSISQPLIIVDGRIPFWDTGGDTILYEDHIELTPAEFTKSGWISNEWPMKGKDWQVNFAFSATSQGKGADGIAFWYTKEILKGGKAFGAAEVWKGLGLFIDTHDNDHDRKNPSIYAILNDGTIPYKHNLDGGRDILARCDKVNVRNKNDPVEIQVSYINGELNVMYKLTRTWKDCFKVAINLPEGYFYGLSASTGGFYDKHSIYSFLTKSSNSQIINDDVVNEKKAVPTSIDSKQKKSEEKKFDTLGIQKDSENSIFKDGQPQTIKSSNTDTTAIEYSTRILDSIEKLAASSDAFYLNAQKNLEVISRSSKTSDVSSQEINILLKSVGNDVLNPIRVFDTTLSNDGTLESTKITNTFTRMKATLDGIRNEADNAHFYYDNLLSKRSKVTSFNIWLVLICVQILVVFLLLCSFFSRKNKYEL